MSRNALSCVTITCMSSNGDETLFPTFLKLAGLPVLVVGGGPVAAGKLDALRAAGAEVTVVAPEICAAIEQAGVRLVRRPFVESDLDGVWYVVSAATPAVNRAVSAAARARRLFVNAVDDPANASAYLGGVVRRGAVTIAISTAGRAPALAALLREGFDALLPAEAELESWFATADEMKRHWRSTGVPMAERRPQLAEALLSRYCGTLPSCQARNRREADPS